MSTGPTPFHIQHIARPLHIKQILTNIAFDQQVDTNSIHSLLIQKGYQITYDGVRRSLDLGSKLGIFEKHKDSVYSLNARGLACQNLALFRHEVYCDVMHFLLYATWEFNNHQDYWSWSYAKICEILWRAKPKVLVQKNIFRQLSSEAMENFHVLNPVVGIETAYAVTNWVRELSPPFFETEDDDKLAYCRDREWFSIELALLVVSYLYQSSGSAISTPLLLDHDTLEKLCPLCFTSTDRILAMIEAASKTFSFLNIHTGEWGSSVILQRVIDISTLA